MRTITPSEILRDSSAARAAYRALNNAGKGFDPTDVLAGETPRRRAETTDDLDIYDFGGHLTLVGTDGVGSEDSRWAVIIDTTGVEVDDA